MLTACAVAAAAATFFTMFVMMWHVGNGFLCVSVCEFDVENNRNL